MVGAVLLALIEGVGLAINKFVMKMQQDSMGGAGAAVDTLEPPIPPGFGSTVLADAGGVGAGTLATGGFELR